MPFKKGQSGNPSGPKPGYKQERTRQWEELGEALITRHSERANKILATLPDDKFLDNFGRLLEYFKPKLGRTEVKQEGTAQIVIKVIEDDGTNGQEA
jgi:hypothetical protein